MQCSNTLSWLLLFLGGVVFLACPATLHAQWQARSSYAVSTAGSHHGAHASIQRDVASFQTLHLSVRVEGQYMRGRLSGELLEAKDQVFGTGVASVLKKEVGPWYALGGVAAGIERFNRNMVIHAYPDAAIPTDRNATVSTVSGIVEIGYGAAGPLRPFLSYRYGRAFHKRWSYRAFTEFWNIRSRVRQLHIGVGLTL